MKTRTILKAGLAIVILAFATGSLSAYNGNGRNRAFQTSNTVSCINQLPDLSEEQVTKITTLEKSHQGIMDALRIERRSTTDMNTKEEIRAKMINQRDLHRAEVNSLLTPVQQQVYAQLHESVAHKYQQTACKQGKSNSRALQTSGRGHGYRSNCQSGCRR